MKPGTLYTYLQRKQIKLAATKSYLIARSFLCRLCTKWIHRKALIARRFYIHYSWCWTKTTSLKI